MEFQQIIKDRIDAQIAKNEAIRRLNRCEHDMIDHLMQQGKGDLLKVRWDRVTQLNNHLPHNSI